MSDRKVKKPFGWWITYGSDRLRGKRERARAKRDLRKNEEPQPRYTTGKMWND